MTDENVEQIEAAAATLRAANMDKTIRDRLAGPPAAPVVPADATPGEAAVMRLGLPRHTAKRLHGTTTEELAADAVELATDLGYSGSPVGPVMPPTSFDGGYRRGPAVTEPVNPDDAIRAAFRVQSRLRDEEIAIVRGEREAS